MVGNRGRLLLGMKPPRYGMGNKASGLSGEQAAGATPTLPHQGGVGERGGISEPQMGWGAGRPHMMVCH
jgi:hypothetical protein